MSRKPKKLLLVGTSTALVVSRKTGRSITEHHTRTISCRRPPITIAASAAPHSGAANASPADPLTFGSFVFVGRRARGWDACAFVDPRTTRCVM